MNNYEQLEQNFKELSYLEHASAILGWDEAVMMPEGGGNSRASTLAYLARLQTEKIQSPEIGKLIQGTSEAGLSAWQASNLREIKRVHKQATAVDSALVQRKFEASMNCEQNWRKLRTQNDWANFKPLLKKVVELAREEANQRSKATGKKLYDAMLDLYDPGQTEEQVLTVFNELKSKLIPLMQKAVEKSKANPPPELKGPFPTDLQRQLGLEVSKQLGFNFGKGRMDVSHHPFCGGVPQDVRITTRYSEQDFTQSLMGVIHETGHALYEQGLPQEWLLQPVGKARGMAMHESQSLFMEMQVARTSAFLKWLFPLAQKVFPQMRDLNSKQFENVFRVVKQDYIRVNADEVTYPFHVILRFELESALIKGDIQVDDLPALWNEKMQSYLGLTTLGNDKDGCMQDVHWPSGAFGYFPSYTLGALTAAQLFATAQKKIPNLLTQIESGQLQPLCDWLRSNIWSQASINSYNDILKAATGQTLNVQFFIDHVQTRYL